jgi:flagellar FliJ protein
VESPRFKFGLERVREIRAHDEDRAKEAFAASLAQRVQGAAMLAAADERMDDAVQAQRLGAPTRSANDFVAAQAWMERVERSREDAARELARHDSELASRRASLAEASRRRQALDRLKERRQAEHALAASRAEAIVLDEIALQQHARGQAA